MADKSTKIETISVSDILPERVRMFTILEQQEIFDLYDTTLVTQAELAKGFNCSTDTIRRVIKNMIYKRDHIDAVLNNKPRISFSAKAQQEPVYNESNVKWVIGDEFINIAAEDKVLTITSDHRNYTLVSNLLTSGQYAKAISYCDIGKELVVISQGNISIEGRVVKYKGVPVPRNIAILILDKVDSQSPERVKLINFFDRLLSNPFASAVSRLYDFLQHTDIKITDDGYILAWKAVRQDYLDIYTGKILNRPGTTIAMDRYRVDPDHDNHCSTGYHVGSMEYVENYGRGDSRILACLIDPSDVVSIPRDHSGQKCRTSKYHVLYEIPRETFDSDYFNADWALNHANKLIKEINDGK